MGEPSIEINQKAFEDAISNALKNYFPRLEPTSNVRVEFYNKFQSEADGHDRDFLGKHNGALDNTLIFAGLLSGVTSAFILAVQTQLQPDYTQLTYDVLVTIANSTGLGVAARPSSDSPWTGPDPTLVRIQCILFSSLASSLLAAFVAMLGKQWLNRYAKVDMRGSLIDRSRDRQRKMDGMATWGFGFVMEGLPLMLQFALLLLGYALSHYLFTIDKVVAAVVVGFTGAGLLFYGVIGISAILSYNCPFQTPLSLIIRFIICLFQEREKHLKRSRKWLRRTFSHMKKQLRSKQGQGIGAADGHNLAELAVTGPFHRPPTFFDEDTNLVGYALDSNCIAWMFDMSMDADVILDIIRFIPEVFWHAGIQTTPLERLYDTVVECCDCSPDRLVVIPKFKHKAYLSAKAFLHVAVQRRCMGNDLDEEAFDSISRRHKAIGYEGDPDLVSTLSMIDRVFGTSGLTPIQWEKFEFTDSHRAWMGRILLYRAWETLGKGEALPDDIKGFVLQSLQVKRPPPAPIVTNCLLMAGLVLGITLHFDDQQAPDKSLKFRSQIDEIYKKLVETFRLPGLTIARINRALEAMELVVRLSEDIATNSYNLFQAIMQAQLPEALSAKKWEACRLAMRGAFGWDNFMPSVGNPQAILNFLNHHFNLANQGGGNQDESIQNALHALGSVPCSVMNEALNHFDPTQPSFVDGIRCAFQDGRPLQLRKAAFFFLPLIADRWFNTRDPIMGSDEMESWCKGWAALADDLGTTSGARKATLTVFFNMLNSNRWRTHIVAEKWRLLEDCISNPEDSEPWRRCLDNPELIAAIPTVGNPPAKIRWLAILWLRHEGLTPVVREKLEAATGGISKAHINVILSAVETELGKASTDSAKFETWSQNPTFLNLGKKKHQLDQTKKILDSFKRAQR